LIDLEAQRMRALIDEHEKAAAASLDSIGDTAHELGAREAAFAKAETDRSEA
jgi:hypothetical protein